MRKFVLLFLAVLASGTLLAQNRQVSGTVTDNAGHPIAGATVIVNETGVGTVTDAQGQYTITAPANGVMNISSLGMDGVEVTVNDRAVIDVTMSYSSTRLDDVLVVAYGTSTRESFTGSAGVMDAEAISKRTSTNVANTLAGQIAGVQIRSSNGQPGSEASIRIRGFTSLNADNTPLYIVDGAPYSGNLSTINPADIESFTVLKDASATALYGARAANGVVMITTKRTQKREAVISFDAKIGVGTRAAIDLDYIKDPAKHYELYYSGLYNAEIKKENATPESAAIAANTTLLDHLYKVYDTGTEPLIVNGKLNPNAKLGNVVGDYYLTPDNWAKEAYKQSLRQEYNVSVNGGTDRATYYLSLGYLNDKGIVAKSSYDRLTARFKGDYQARKWLKVGGNIAYTHSNTSVASGYDVTDGLSSGNVFAFTSRIAPIFPLYLRDATTKDVMIDERGAKMYDYGDLPFGARAFLTGGNPVGAVLLDDDSSNANVFNLTGFAEATIIEGLKINITGTNYLNESRASNFTNPYYGQYASSGGIIWKNHSRAHGINLVETISYGRRIEKHNFDVMFGHENYIYKTTSLSGTKDHMFGTAIHELNAAVNIVSTGSTATSYNTEGYFLRAKYDYDNRYFAEASYRRDATSRFHPDNRWGNFWSLGASWLISNEKFLANASWIDMLKLRASYGSTGNDRIGDFRYVDNFEIVSSNNGVSVIPMNRGNKDITWETNASFDIGVDFEFFNGRLSGTFDYFNRTTYDLLFSLPTPESSGFSSYFTNIGDMRNSGVELDLTGVAVRTKNLNLSFYANLTHNKNKILRLPPERVTETQNGFPSGSYFITEGGSIYDWYLRDYAGVDPDTGESLWYTSETDVHMNQKGERETTKIHSDATQYRQKSAMPDLYGGFGTTFYFYGFDLSINFDYQIGGTAYDAPYATSMRSVTAKDGEAFHKDLLNAWSETNRTSNIPRFQYGDSYSSGASNRFLTDASYLNLQNINFGYTLPSKWTNKIRISSIRIYCSAENITYWSKRKGLDPRQNWNGSILNVNYSPIRTISGGLQLSF